MFSELVIAILRPEILVLILDELRRKLDLFLEILRSLFHSYPCVERFQCLCWLNVLLYPSLRQSHLELDLILGLDLVWLLGWGCFQGVHHIRGHGVFLDVDGSLFGLEGGLKL